MCACKYVRMQVGMSRLSGLYTALNIVKTNICLAPPVCLSRWLSAAFSSQSLNQVNGHGLWKPFALTQPFICPGSSFKL